MLRAALIAASYLLAITAAANGQSAPSLDEQLLEDLGGGLLDDAPPPPSQEPSPAADGEPQPPPFDPPAGEDLGQSSENPLESIGRRMRSVQRRISELDTAGDTQGMQRQIVADLSALIEQLEKAQQQQRRPQSRPRGGDAGGTSRQETANPKDSDDEIRPGREDVTADPLSEELLRRVWGHLPERVRRSLQSGTPEEVLPEYRELVEEYHKRLAEDRRESP